MDTSTKKGGLWVYLMG